MADKFLYAFGDETGDLGFAFERGSSRYFAITMIFTNQPDCIHQQIQRLRLRLGLSCKAEFRFHDMSNNFRSQFLTTIQVLPFEAYVLVADKIELKREWQTIDNPTLYALFLAKLVKHIPQESMESAILTLDQFGPMTAMRFAIRRELKQLGKRPFKRINMKRSQGNDLIQCADMVAGAVMRYWQRQDRQFLQLIESKVTVWQFPDNENPPS